ncbi:16S rRNA (cytidine(1402)-2'-O)-methyltransferase [Caldisalinibacter kiritimatiensis]|uniref:Ribosomal RNA small subunit methyltransferase I n=1 Tax=Caldisalinibacter kiritimatiensis TaxID=1304284 RepID=R1AV65_9FIRM|nr:16S rRNA (cytidine(1402)-2'-O)-methyltransferase [Caldisalinibacter kiritimatiensis]EOD01063.1 rRNA small subunit methyltransferase I [Caldisalinibacter kiritimatiensis]
MANKSTLYICPTPIGNLDDITIRVLNILKEVDLIAAEDTRHTIKLLNHFNIKKPLTSYHEHNKKEKGRVLIDKLLNGENIALVSDAGMPGISDPGEDLIRQAIENDINVVGLPGATASILALVVSGLPTDKFVFEGFLSSKKKERKESLTELKREKRTIILYESPHRLKALLKDIVEVLGDREIAVVRELTKKYEEVFRGTVSEAIKKINKEGVRGEFVVVIKGAENDQIKDEEKELWLDISIKEHIILYINKGFSKKEAIKKVSVERGIPKREVYKEAIEIQV